MLADRNSSNENKRPAHLFQLPTTAVDKHSSYSTPKLDLTCSCKIYHVYFVTAASTLAALLLYHGSNNEVSAPFIHQFTSANTRNPLASLALGGNSRKHIYPHRFLFSHVFNQDFYQYLAYCTHIEDRHSNWWRLNTVSCTEHLTQTYIIIVLLYCMQIWRQLTGRFQYDSLNTR